MAATYPTATETIGDGVDSDCDGGEICFVDADNDAYIVSSGATIASSDEDCEDAGEGTNLDKTGDCDDGDGAINPGATEVCDASNVDENCNGRADDADSTTDASTKTDYYQDADKDRYGDMSGTASAYCDDPSTTSDWWTSDHTDCDDRDSSIYPGASETIGDSVDSDCDGGEICFVDGDDDGYRTTTTVTSTDEDCLDAGEGEVGDPAGDCNDGNAEINPGAVEKCDGLDNDCDASTSEDGSSWMTWTDSSGSPASSHFPASSWSSSYSESSPWEFTVSSSYSDLVMTFCKGTYPVNLTFAVDVDIRGRTGTASDVIFSGGSTSKAVFSIITNNIDLSAENVTIQNGDGVNGFQSKADSGGGIYCNSTGLSSTLTLDNVVMKDNVAGGARGSGAALASDGCAVTMTDSIIRDNTSVNGALAIADAPLNLDNVDFYDNDGAYISGAYLYSDVVATTATLRDVTFSRNDTTDTSKSWGALHADGDTSGSIITLNLIDTLFEHNTAAATAAVTSTQPNGSGLYVSQFVEVFWDADTATSVGALDNDLNGVVLFGLMATLDAVDVDLGIAGSSDDNDLADVATSRSLYRANNNRDFICDRESCSNDARNPDGDPTNDEYVCDIGATTLNTSGDNRFRGNVIRADRNSTLESVDAFLDVDSSCDLDFYVMERSGTSGAWTVLFSRINAPRTTVGAGWQNSGHIGVPVTSGKYYLIFTAWNCPTTSQTVRYYFHNTPGNPGFGSFSTNVLSSGTYGSSTAYAEGNSYTLSFNAYSGSTADRYKARYNLNDLETTSTADCIP